MKPILYYDDISPPVRSILLFISALDIDVEYKQVDLVKREHLNEEFIKINPLHRVPVLEDNDLILTDSHAILIYLCDMYGKDTTFSLSNPKQRAKIINRLFFNSSILFRCDSDVMHEIFHRQLNTLGHHRDKIIEAYDYLEVYLSKTKYIATDELSIADFSIVATLSTLDILLQAETERWPNVKRWFAAMKRLPYYQTANQIGLDKLKDKLQQYSQIRIH